MAKYNGKRFPAWMQAIWMSDECTPEMGGVLQVLSWHQGKQDAIKSRELVQELKQLGWWGDVHRDMRVQINKLRKLGALICSAGGNDGGYWIAASWDELEEYLQRELHSRAMDLLDQEKHLRAAAESVWGKYSPQKQLRMEL